MKTLSALLEREITFEMDGKSFPVKLLPILFFEEYKKILEETEKEISSRNITEGRKKLRLLLCHVWPKKKRKLLFHFDYPGLCNVARVLFFGEEYLYRKEKAPEKEKKTPEKEIDLMLMAGRIMHHFPSFDLEKISLLPLPVFMNLDHLASRIQADDALSLFIPAIAAGMGTEGISATLEKIRNDTPPSSVPAKEKLSYTREELEKAVAKLSAPRMITKEIKAGMQFAE